MGGGPMRGKAWFPLERRRDQRGSADFRSIAGASPALAAGVPPADTRVAAGLPGRADLAALRRRDAALRYRLGEREDRRLDRKARACDREGRHVLCRVHCRRQLERLRGLGLAGRSGEEQQRHRAEERSRDLHRRIRHASAREGSLTSGVSPWDQADRQPHKFIEIWAVVVERRVFVRCEAACHGAGGGRLSKTLTASSRPPARDPRSAPSRRGASA